MELSEQEKAELRVYEILLKNNEVSRLLTGNGESFIKEWLADLRKKEKATGYFIEKALPMSVENLRKIEVENDI